MTMHLAHPALTTVGKKKGKKKWASAEAKRKSEMLAEERRKMLAEYNITTTKRSRTPNNRDSYKPNYDHPSYRDQKHIPSLTSSWAVCAKPPDRKYTGTLIKGIATMHKSNAVPVINEEEMISISRMRRG